MKRAVVLAVLLLAGCSQQAEPVPEVATSEAPATMASNEPTGSVPASPTGPASRYTSFKDCILVKANEDEDWSSSHCAGMAGYDLQIDYGDARDDLVLLRRGKPPAKLGLIALGGGGFNALADTAEWRGVLGPTGFVPKHLIVRNNISEDPENSEKQTSILVVIDLQQACVIAQVRPKAGQNEAAWAIADGPVRPCLKA